MPDELTQLLDAWGRTQASSKQPGLLPASPSAGYLSVVRRTRHRRMLALVSIVVAGAAALIVLVYAVMPSMPPASPAQRDRPLNTQDR